MEVLAALLIASLVIVTISNLFVLSTNQVSLGREETQAVLYAQEKLEELMQVEATSTDLHGGYYADVPAEGYLRQWWIHEDVPAKLARIIIIEVQFKHWQGDRTVEIAAIRP